MAWTAPKTWAFQEGVESTELNIHLRDNLLAMGPHLIAFKNADETVTSNTVLQNDDDLLVTVAANAVWYTTWTLLLDVNTTPNIKVSWTWPSGTGALSAPFFNAAGTFTAVNVATSGAAADMSGAATLRVAHFEGIHVIGGTGGTLQFQFAQNTSSGSATTIKRGSSVYGVQLA